MPGEKDPRNDPSTLSAAYQAMRPVWSKIETLLGGTESMRAAGETMTPRHENEGDASHSERIARASLLNMAQLTLDNWVGRPFGEPIQIGDDVPEDVTRWLRDIDLQGNGVSVFSRDWFRKGLSKAFAHVLIDAPSDDGVQRTLADDAREQRRPFWNFIRPENLFAASATVIDGREVLTHVRIFEQETVRDGFAESTVDRIRVFDRILPGESAAFLPGFEGIELLEEDLQSPELGSGVWVTLYRKIEKSQGKVEWVVERLPTRLDDRMDEIPLVSFYADREQLLLGKPPIEDLVDLNINWWQSNSDQNSILTVARFPILALSGGDEEDEDFEIGPKRILFTPNERGKFYYVEHEGAAIAAGREHLQDLESQMAQYGAQFLKKRPGSETATARALDSAEATSPLQDATMRFNESLNQALRLTGKWVGIEDAGTLIVNAEFSGLDDGDTDTTTLDKARARGDLSKRDYFEELVSRGVLRETFDFDENERNLELERMSEGEVTDVDPFAEE